MRKLFFIALLVVFANKGESAVVYDTLHINPGIFTTVDGSTFPYLAFNSTAVYDAENHRIHISTFDSLYLTVINNDVNLHGFNITNYAGVSSVLNPSDTITLPCYFDSEAVHIFYDDDKKYKYQN